MSTSELAGQAIAYKMRNGMMLTAEDSTRRNAVEDWALETGGKDSVAAVAYRPQATEYLPCEGGLTAQLEALKAQGCEFADAHWEGASVLFEGTDARGQELAVEFRSMATEDAATWRLLCAQVPQDPEQLDRFWEEHAHQYGRDLDYSRQRHAPERKTTLEEHRDHCRQLREGRGRAERAQERDRTQPPKER